MKPKLNLFAVLFLFGISNVNAQTQFTPEVLSSAGQHVQGPSLNVEFTLGEFATSTVGDDPKVTQGFNQPRLEIMIRVIDPQYDGKIYIFPNPANEILNVTTDEQGEFDLIIYDLKGELMNQSTFSYATQLNVSGYPHGAYVIVVKHYGLLVYAGVIEKNK